MKFKRQIYLGFALVVILPLFSTLWTIRATKKVDEKIASLDFLYPILDKTNQISIVVNELTSRFADAAIDPDQERRLQCETIADHLDSLLQMLEEQSADPDVTRIRRSANTYRTKGLEVIDSLMTEEGYDYFQYGNPMQKIAANLKQDIETYHKLVSNEFSSNLTTVREISTTTRALSWITSLIAFLTGTLLAFVFANHFSQQDVKLRKANDELGTRYQEISRSKELLEKEIIVREQMEKKLRQSLSFEEALSQVSGLFATTHTPNLRQVPKTLGQVVLCDLTFIVTFDQNGDRIENQVEWCQPDALSCRPNEYNIDFRSHPRWFSSLSEDGNVVVDDISMETKASKDALTQSYNLKSIAIVPITSKKKELWGYMGFAQFINKRTWSLETLRLLRVASEMLSNFLARQRAEERLKHDAFHDNLTGLPNRALFMDRLSHLIERFERHPDEEFAVLFLDLDRFKPINDSMGHPIGDQLLIQVARSLEECVRQQDTVARLGGDEFTVLLEDVNGAQEVQIIAKRILQRLEQPFILGDFEVHTSASIGVKLCKNGDNHPDDVVRDADIAMYEAKNRGKSRFVLFHPSMHRQTTTVVQMESDLRKAIEKNELALYFQPILSFKTGTIIGFEALLRWFHTTRGTISPAEFIPLAEETGLIIPIGQWVLEKACEQTYRWHQDGFNDITMAVNVSAPQFYEKTFTDSLGKTLETYKVPTNALHLEITEGMLMENVELNIATLQRINEMGILLSVDDFGTGYSSLSYLKRFPLQTLKVDQSFVKDIPGCSDDSAITNAIIAMGLSLQLTIVAEGVEKTAQFNYLKERGCHKFQGYLVSGPLNPEGATELLKKYYKTPFVPPPEEEA